MQLLPSSFHARRTAARNHPSRKIEGNMDSGATTYESVRRTTRVRAEVSVRVVSQDPRAGFSEHCQTVVVNCEGCGIRLTRPVEVGLRVSIEELPGGLCAQARVTSCVALGGGGKNWLVGMELEQRGNVWSIQPAPADWSSAPASSSTTIPAPQKKGEWPYSFFSPKGEAHPGRK
jgi:hypothetical protein